MAERARPVGNVLWPAVMVGVGVAGTLDEVLLHQLLRWHHFYDRSSATMGVVTDGLFHMFSTVMLAWGGWLLLKEQSWRLSHTRAAWGAVFLGAGGFNLYDGTLQHKLFRFHQVRGGARNQLPYDVAFIGAAVVVMLVGVVLLRSTSKTTNGRQVAPAIDGQ